MIHIFFTKITNEKIINTLFIKYYIKNNKAKPFLSYLFFGLTIKSLNTGWHQNMHEKNTVIEVFLKQFLIREISSEEYDLINTSKREDSDR